MKEKTKKTIERKPQIQKESKISKASEIKCNAKNCHIHGKIKLRGKIFEGEVKKKFSNRVVIEFDRSIYIRKYERYQKSKTKIHARLPLCMDKQINVGDIIKIQETRPLSKIIHAVVLGKIKGPEKSKIKPLEIKGEKNNIKVGTATLLEEKTE